MMRRDTLSITGYVLLCFILFIAIRVCFVFFSPDMIFTEEAKVATLGYDIVHLHKLRLPLWGYMDSPHAGGSLLAGFCAVPFYMLFGDTYLAIKMTALSISLLTLALLLYLLLPLIQSKWRWLVFACLFIFSTPYYLQRSVILMGNNLEPVFLCVTMISLYILWCPQDKQRYVPWVTLGAIAGFSFWMQAMTMYCVFAIVLCTIIEYKKRSILRLLWLMGGFLIGMIPFFVFNLNTDFIFFYDKTCNLIPGLHFDRLKQLFLQYFPAMFHFQDIGFIKAYYFGCIFYVVILFALSCHIYRVLCTSVSGRYRTLVSLILLQLFFAVCGFFFTIAPITVVATPGWNTMDVGAEYYLLWMVPFLFVLLVLWEPRRNIIVRFMQCVCVLICTIQCVAIFSNVRYQPAIMQPWRAFGSNIFECGYHYVYREKLFLDFMKHVPREHYIDYLSGAGMSLAERIGESDEQRAYVVEIAELLNNVELSSDEIASFLYNLEFGEQSRLDGPFERRGDELLFIQDIKKRMNHSSENASMSKTDGANLV